MLKMSLIETVHFVTVNFVNENSKLLNDSPARTTKKKKQFERINIGELAL